MSKDESTDAPKGGARRLRAILKLVLLLGTPLLVLFSIFAGGVYCGASRSAGVVGFEERWLGIDPPEGFEAKASGQGETEGEAKAGGGEGGESGAKAGAEGGETEGEAKPDTPETKPDTPETKPDTPETPPETKPDTPETKPNTPEAEPRGLPIAVVEAPPSKLSEAFGTERIVEVKVLVDPALQAARKDWISYVQELVAASSASFEALFGIELRLHGVVVWEGAGAQLDALREDLANHEREGADILIGLVARPRPSGYAEVEWTGTSNGDHVLVFADLEQEERYYRGLLRGVAGLFGARAVRDRQSAAWLRGSFMGGATVEADAPPWIDPENRAVVIANKQRGFTGLADEPDDSDADEEDEP